MTGKVSFNLNNTTYQFELDEGDGLKLLNQMIVLGNPPRSCPYIKGGAYKLVTNKDSDGNIYINMMCYGSDKDGKKTAYRSKLGTYKDKSGFFWNSWEEDEFAKKRLSGETSAPAQEPEETDDIPF